MDVAETMALATGVAWASGLNLYAAVLMLGLMAGHGHVQLPAELDVLTHRIVLAAAGLMYVLEFVADKVPGIDSLWDAIHSFIRVPAGAVLAAAAVGDVHPATTVAAALAGGTLAAGSHVTKAGSRVLINTSPEPITNWTASLGEDLMVFGGLWTALTHPWLFLSALVVFILLVLWLLPRLWRACKSVMGYLSRPFGRREPPGNTADTPCGKQHESEG